MKKILLTVAVLMFMGTAFSQGKLLQWNQLMDYKLYPQRAIHGYMFNPGNDNLMYKRDTLYMVFDGKIERTMTDDERDTYTATSMYVPSERVETKEGCLYVDGTLVEKGDGYNIVLGESVHRNEFGINGGLFWSPEESRLAFYRMDQSMVVDYPLVNTKAREAEVRNIKYPMAGMKSHEVTVGVWDTHKEKLIYLDTRRDTSVHEREMYLTNIAWSPDEKYIFIAKINRE